MMHILAKRLCLVAVSCSIALAAPVWAGPEDLTPEEARHLISRTGFGAAPWEIASVTGMSRDAAVDQILQAVSPDPHLPLPSWTEGWDYPSGQIWALGNTEGELFFARRYMEIEELRDWWLAEMIGTPSPLTERLTLFWSDHFASSFDAIEDSRAMARQNVFFRQNAMGRFEDLAKGILHDPVMLVYLTNTENVKDAPNENLAREFFELFTLGEGRGYTEADIREAARALTGHTIEDMAGTAFLFQAEDHDGGKKMILGERGRHKSDDLVEITLNHPAFGPYIVEKLWQEFVSDTPDPAEVARLSALWRASGFEMQPLLREMLLSPAFWDPANRGRLIKSPVDLTVGTVRTLGLEVGDVAELGWQMSDMGQALFFPPNVAGWPGGEAWVTDAGITLRAALLHGLLDGSLGSDRAPGMMMQSGQAGTPVNATRLQPQDLRVGQVFALETVEMDEGGLAAFLSLYDVAFQGENWRSLNLWIEVPAQGDDVPFIAVHTADCKPGCFPGWPQDDEDPHWVWFAAWEDMEDEIDTDDPAGVELISALTTHLPDMLRSAKEQYPWTRAGQKEGNLSFRKTIDWIEVLRDEMAEVLPRNEGNLVLAMGPNGSLGLGDSYRPGMSLDDIDAMIEMEEEAGGIAATPPVVYASLNDWFGNLPAATLASRRAEAALLALPLPDEGRRDEMVAPDLEALLRALILSPYFQVK